MSRRTFTCPNCRALRIEIQRLQKLQQSHYASTRTEALRLYATGLPARTVGMQLGISASTIHKWTKQAGISRPRKRNTHHVQMVGAAVAAVRNGFTMKAAARNYDIGYATLRRHCIKAGVSSPWNGDRSKAKGSVPRGRNSRPPHQRRPRAKEIT